MRAVFAPRLSGRRSKLSPSFCKFCRLRKRTRKIQIWTLPERRSRLQRAGEVPIFAAIRDRKETQEESAKGWAGTAGRLCERFYSRASCVDAPGRCLCLVPVGVRLRRL